MNSFRYSAVTEFASTAAAALGANAGSAPITAVPTVSPNATLRQCVVNTAKVVASSAA